MPLLLALVPLASSPLASSPLASAEEGEVIGSGHIDVATGGLLGFLIGYPDHCTVPVAASAEPQCAA